MLINAPLKPLELRSCEPSEAKPSSKKLASFWNKTDGIAVGVAWDHGATRIYRSQTRVEFAPNGSGHGHSGRRVKMVVVAKPNEAIAITRFSSQSPNGRAVLSSANVGCNSSSLG